MLSMVSSPGYADYEGSGLGLGLRYQVRTEIQMELTRMVESNMTTACHHGRVETSILVILFLVIIILLISLAMHR